MTTAHNAQGLPQSLTGTDAYVTSAGNIKVILFNNSATDPLDLDSTTFNYQIHKA